MPENSYALSCFVILYYQLDTILKPLVYDNYELFQAEPIEFYPIVKSANIFIFSIIFSFSLYLFFLSKIKNFTLYSLAFVYLKYIIDNLTYFNHINVYQYEFRRTVMWLFSTPLILKLYADMNQLSLTVIHSEYHMISNFLRILLFPFRKTCYNTIIILSLSIFEGYFIYTLFNFEEYKYTRFIIYTWTLFSFLTVLEIFQIFDVHDIQLFYLLSDMITKFTMMLIINDYEQQIYNIKNNVDLQSISLLTSMNKTIKQFEKSTILTSNCKSVIEQINKSIINIIPTDKTTLKLELLKKILPFELENNYLSNSTNYREHTFICVLFTDIVSYTELAKKYDSGIIFKLLNDIYTRFDDLVLRYPNLQKIETIGDAYMVVGDLYNNDTKTNIKNMLLLAIEFMKEVKYIYTPDNKPLELRIGIHLGKVVVGILGSEIPRLCVVGNTVNVAARLQSTADANTIQISRHIYEVACHMDDFNEMNFIERKNVFLKNIGSITTYVVDTTKQYN